MISFKFLKYSGRKYSGNTILVNLKTIATLFGIRLPDIEKKYAILNGEN